MAWLRMNKIKTENETMHLFHVYPAEPEMTNVVSVGR